MRRYPYLLNRNGHYYFRIAIPGNLIEATGKKEIWCSLRTQHLREAVIRSNALMEIMKELFLNTDLTRNIIDYTLHTALQSILCSNVPGINQPRPYAGITTPAMFTVPSPPQSPPISQVFESYLAECKDRQKTLLTKRAVLNLWLNIIGDTAVGEIGKAQAREFKQVVMKLPSNLNKRYKGKSIKEIDLDAITTEQRLSVKSININLGMMGTFVNWMIRNGHYEASNPFTGLNLKDTERAIEKRHPFSKEQLQAILSSPIYTGCLSARVHDRYITGDLIIKDGLYWVPLIALYSGARLQEICQLYVSDLKQIGDVWVFDFNDIGDDKLIKTSSSHRKTPIHPKLIGLGILELRGKQIKNNQQRLLSDLPKAKDGTYSSIFSKRFNNFLERFEIKTDRTSFHSFRHTFIDALRNTDVAKEVREALVGHLDRRSAHDNYGSAIGITRLYQGICQVEF